MIKASGNITVDSAKIIRTDGSDLTLWSNSAGGSGRIQVAENACLSTIGTCTEVSSGKSGSIYLGGGVGAGDIPSGSVSSSNDIGIRLGSADLTTGGVKILAGAGDISINGESAVFLSLIHI